MTFCSFWYAKYKKNLDFNQNILLKPLFYFNISSITKAIRQKERNKLCQNSIPNLAHLCLVPFVRSTLVNNIECLVYVMSKCATNERKQCAVGFHLNPPGEGI